MSESTTLQTVPGSFAKTIKPLWSQNGIGSTRSIEKILLIGDEWVAFGKGSGLFSSPSGKNWGRMGTVYPGDEKVTALAHGNSKWVAAGNGHRLYSSDDGVIWREEESPFPTGDTINCLCFAGTGWYAGSERGRVAFSGNGMAWENSRMAFVGGEPVNAIASHGGKTVAVGDVGRLAEITPTTSFERFSTFHYNPINDIAHSNGMWVIAGGGGRTSTSVDGSVWAKQDPAPSNKSSISKLLWDNDRWFAIRADGKIEISKNIIDGWDRISTVNRRTDRWIAVGRLIGLAVDATQLTSLLTVTVLDGFRSEGVH